MEKIVLYIPELQRQFHTNKPFQLQVSQRSETYGAVSNVLGGTKQRRLHLHSACFGEMPFHYVLFDFKNDSLTFKRKIGNEDTARMLNEIFTLLQIDFAIQSISYLIERPICKAVKTN